MQYTAVRFSLSFDEDFATDIFVAQLAEIGFESFESENEGIVAYIPTTQYDSTKLNQLLTDFPYRGAALQEVLTIADKNWNEEWEKHFFKPIVIGNECVIYSSFHTEIPKAKYGIIINPKMAFGTGHHATTSLMIEELLHCNLQGKTVLDMGCGTAVLAILAAMRGAKLITAIDIDNWCTENAVENIAINKVENIKVKLGDAKLLKNKHFDIILANINRNILLQDMPIYSACLPENGLLFLSGFYTEDISLLEVEAHRLGLKLDACREKDNWAMMKLRKCKEN